MCQWYIWTTVVNPLLLRKIWLKNSRLNVVSDNYASSIIRLGIRINSKIVELKINENESPIYLICVPKIRTKLSLPGLSGIAKEFDNR